MVFDVIPQPNIFEWTFQTNQTVVNVGEHTSLPDGVLSGVTHHPDGKRIYTMDSGNNRMREYILSTAWDVSSVTSNTTILSSIGGGYTDLTTENGLDWYFVTGGADAIYLHNATTPWDIATINTNATANLSVSGQFSSPLGCFITGKYLYVCGQTNKLALYDLTNGLASARLVEDVNIGENFQGIVSSPDGYKLYCLDRGNNQIEEITVPLGFKGFTGNTLETSNININTLFGSTNVRGMTIDRTTGKRFVIVDRGQDKLYSGRFDIN